MIDKTRTSVKRILIFSILIFLTSSGFSATFFVSPDGVNGNPGSQQLPLLIIQDAIDLCISGNDTIFLEEGSYWQRLVFSTKSGIYLSSINPANKSTLSGSGVEGLEMIYIENSDSITIANLIMREKFVQDAKAIYALGQGDGLFIIDCEIFNVGWSDDFFADPEEENPVGQAHAILINGRTVIGYKNVYIGRNEISFLNLGNSEGITLTGNVFNFLIEQNLIFNLTNIGIDIAGHYSWAFPPEGDQNLNQARSGRIRNNIIYNCRRTTPGNEPAAIYVDGGKDIFIDNNSVYQNGTGISAGCENPAVSAENITITQNLIYNNDKFGTVFGANSGVLESSVCRNNTFFNNGLYFDNSGSISLQNSNNSVVRNNIVYITSEDYFGLSMFGFLVNNLQIDNNLFFNPDGNNSRVFAYSPAAGSSETNELPIFQDPLLVSANLNSPDLHLNSGSPAIDAASINVTLIPDERDMDGNLVALMGLDIGAYAWESPTFIATNSVNRGLVYPNPCRDILFFTDELGMNSRVQVIDAQGRTFIDTQLSDMDNRYVSTNKLIPGFYILRIGDKEQTRTGSFIKIE